jgi:uncharacterized membrane protein
MSLLLVVAVAAVAGWHVRRTALVLLPLLAAVIYGAAVFVGGAGRDGPVLALAVLAEVGLGAGVLGRRYLAAQM